MVWTSRRVGTPTPHRLLRCGPPGRGRRHLPGAARARGRGDKSLGSPPFGPDPAQGKVPPRPLTALGSTYAVEGEVDEACRLGSEALSLAVSMAVQSNLQDVVTLRQLLEQWRDTRAVRDLDE